MAEIQLNIRNKSVKSVKSLIKINLHQRWILHSGMSVRSIHERLVLSHNLGQEEFSVSCDGRILERGFLRVWYCGRQYLESVEKAAWGLELGIEAKIGDEGEFGILKKAEGRD